MSPNAATASWSGSTSGGRGALWWEGALSVVLGAGFTLALFVGIAWYETVTPPDAAPEIADLGMAMLPLAPPPPPTPTETDATAIPLPMAGFELAPSSSAVKVAASPAPLDLIPPQELSRAPVASIALHLPVNFRPHAALQADTQHIYQRFEVDTVPTILLEKTPQVSSRDMDGESIRRVTLIWVIEADGTVTNVRVARTSGNPRFDARIIDTIQDSVFSPAIKGGRKVRMMTQQLITVKWSSGSPFH